MRSGSFQDKDFKKSSLCNFDPVCVEVARKEGLVAIRSSRKPDQDPVVFDHNEWGAFIAGVKNGEFEV